jgi:hypothetical protein
MYVCISFTVGTGQSIYKVIEMDGSVLNLKIIKFDVTDSVEIRIK